MRSPKVVCLGVHLLDVLVRHPTAPSIEPGWQILDDLRITAAGTAAGPAVDLAKLGAQPLEVGGMVRDEGGPTHVSLLFIGPDGERNPIMIRPTGARPLRLADIDMDVVAEADVLHVGGADQLGEFVEEGLTQLIGHARANDTIVTVDVLAMTDEAMRDRLAPALSQAQFFFPNEGQLAEMTGTEDPAEGVARLRDEVGVETVIGTLGGEGSLILGPGGEARVPAFDIEVVDTTGCGDAYVAGFIVATANGWDAEAAGYLGTAASGLVATGLGSDSGIVDLASTLEFMATQAPERVAGMAQAS